MSASVRFTTTSDGVRIAYAAQGRGPLLVYMAPIPLRHVERELHLPEDRNWIERLGRGRTIVRYDPRGIGLSAREADRFDLGALELDLAAVVDAAGDDRVALVCCLNTAPIGVAYAAHYPDRVSHLVLWCPVARMSDSVPPQLLTLLDVAEKDWELFTEAAAGVMVGWSKGEAAHRYADYLRACITPESARRFVEGLGSADVHDLLGEVRSPTLVVHRRGVQSIPLERAMEIAARIPDATLVLLDGEFMRPGAGDVEAAARAIETFLGDTAPVSDVAPEARNQFRREGEYWTLAFDGRVSRIRDSKGLHHLAHLLGNPGVEVAAAELVADREPGSAGTAAPGDAGAILDRQARDEYRRRLVDLRSELDDAERNGNRDVAARAEAEIEFLAGELAVGLGLGGRERKASSAAERARLTVTKRIKDAISKVRGLDEKLALHLTRTIRTGHFCSYRPELHQPVAWVI